MSESTTTPANVYLIQVESGPVKIGISIDVSQRLAGLQSSNHELLTLFYRFDCESVEQARTIEQLLHARYSNQHIRGEWYRVDPTNIVTDLEFFIGLCEVIRGIRVEIINSPVARTSTMIVPTPRVDLREVAKQVYENGDIELRAIEMMAKYNISMGSTSKVREMLQSANGHGE